MEAETDRYAELCARFPLCPIGRVAATLVADHLGTNPAVFTTGGDRRAPAEIAPPVVLRESGQ